MTTITNNNGTITITADAKAFVIPNSANTPDCFLEFCQEQMKRVCELNSIDFKENDKWVEVWLHTDDPNSENIVYDGVEYVDQNDGTILRLRYILGYIPQSVLKNVKEGDTFNWKLYATAEIINDHFIESEVILDLNITAQQRGYRYSRFGNFENVVEHVTY